MDQKVIIREIIIWVISFLISILISYPIFSQIEYKYLFHSIFGIVMMIQIFRWYVFYEKVIFFRKIYWKFFTIVGLFWLGFFTLSISQEILLTLENQSLTDISYGIKKDLNLIKSYELFTYLKNLLIWIGFGTAILSLMLIIKILYRSIGMGSQKVKTYLGK